jgi:hypothetical protein
MKWIKSRKNWLNEAKLRDVIFKQQAEEVKRTWGEKFLDYEEVTPTDKIKQGKWKLSEEDKMSVLGAFFDCDMKEVMSLFESIPDDFATTLSASINTELIRDNKERYVRVLKDFNIKKPSIDQMVAIFDSVFRKLNVAETQGTEEIQKDETGRPVRGEDGQMIKVAKVAGEPRYEKNLVNINSFVESFRRAYPDSQISPNHFKESNLNSLVNLAKEACESEYQVDFEIFNRDLYLNITHNPKDILNMSISKFYSSCQHLYSGGHRKQLLGNVFDPNSIPAFLTFETPIFWKDEKISEQLPLSRMIIRNIETFDETKAAKIYFDRAYPDRVKEIFDQIVPKYSGNNQTAERSDVYIFSPDVQAGDTEIREPYMDRLDIETVPMIGANTKSLHLNRVNDWSKIKISPKAKLREVVIETTKLPQSFLDLEMDLDWIKFKFLKLWSFEPFRNLKYDSIAFDKCQISEGVISEIAKTNPDVKKIQIISSEIRGFDFKIFEKLQELHLLFTAEDLDEVISSISGMKLKKLVISGDLISSEEDKKKIQKLRASGISVDVKGPVI